MDCLYPVALLADVPPFRVDHFLEESFEAADRLVPGIAPCFRIITGQDESQKGSITSSTNKVESQAGWISYITWPFASAETPKDPKAYLVNLDSEPSLPPTEPFLSPHEGMDLGMTALDLASRCRPVRPDLFVVLDEASIHYDTCEIVYFNGPQTSVQHVTVSFRNAQKVLEQLRYGTTTISDLQKRANESNGVYGKKRVALKYGEKAKIKAKQPLIDLDDY